MSDTWWGRAARRKPPLIPAAVPLHVELLESRDLPAAFTPGNLVVYRVGTGAESLVATGNAVFLDEYKSDGTFVQSVPMPTAAGGGNNALIAAGNAIAEGLLTRSVDGRYLVLTGYAAEPGGATSLLSTTATSVPRVVGLVDAAGNIDTTTALTDFASGSSPRSATSTDGTDLWMTGGTSSGTTAGVRYTTRGATTSTQLSTTITNLRQVEVVDGELYVTGTGGFGVVRFGVVGTGTPTTSGQTVTSLPGFPTSGSPYSFFFADLDSSVAGVDTVYVTEDTTNDGIHKYSLVSGTWTANGSVAATDIRGLTGVVEGTTVKLYGTTGGNTATGGGSLYAFTDNKGYNVAISGSVSTIATAGANTAFRGVALAPVAGTSSTVTVAAITRDGASPTNAAAVSWTVTFSDAISGLSPSHFTLSDLGNSITGETVSSVTAVPGSGNTQWTVTARTGSGDGTLRLVVDNAAGASTTPTNLPFSVTTADYVLDRTVPLVQSVTRSNPTDALTRAAAVEYTVVFTEAVTGVDAGDFAVTVTGLAEVGVTGVTGDGTTYTVTVSTGSGDGTLRLDVTDNDTITDAAGNLLGGGGTGNGAFTGGQVYTIDRTPPVVTSVIRADPSPTSASEVVFTVGFSEAVGGVDADAFAVFAVGPVGARVRAVTGSGDTYTVTVDTGSGDGTIRLDVIDADTVADAAGNPLGGAGTGNGTFTSGQAYTIDRTPPAVASITRGGGNPTNAPDVEFTVAFTEPVTGLDPSDFVVVATGPTGASIAAVSGSGSEYTVTVHTGTGDGLLRLDVADDDSIRDAAGRSLGGPGAGNGDFTTGEVYSIDKTAPVVLSVTRLSPTESVTSAALVRFTVVFDEPVTGVGTDDFTLTTAGVSGAVITEVSGGGTDYTVTVETGTGDGTVRLDVADDDSIRDAAGNPLGGAGGGNGDSAAGQSFTLDRTPPTVDIGPPSAPLTRTGPVTFAVAYTDLHSPVVSLSAADVTVHATGTAAAGSVAVSGSGLEWTITLDGITGDGTLAVALAAGTATDGAGNTSSAVGPGAAVEVDNTPPDVSAPTLDPDTDSGIRPDDAITAAPSLRFVGTAEPGATIDLCEADTHLGRSLAGVDGVWVIAGVSLAEGGHSVFARATDAAGNAADSAPRTVVVDTSPPQVAAISHTPAGPVPFGTPLTFTVGFSPDLDAASLSAADFENAGTASITVDSIRATAPGTVEVVVTPTTFGTLQLRVLAANLVLDIAGNALPASATDPTVVTVTDDSPPAVVSIRLAGGSPTNAASVAFTVHFSEPVFGVTPEAFTLTAGGLSGAVVTGVSGGGDTYTVTANTGSGDGTLRLDLTDDDTIADGSAYPLGGFGAANGSFRAGEVYALDRTPPRVVSIVPLDPVVTNGDAVRFRVTFDESVVVAGVDAADFAITTEGVGFADAAVGPVTAGPADTVFDVALAGIVGDGTLTLSVTAGGATIADPAGNALAVGLAGPTYIIDRTPPVPAVGAAAGQPDPTQTLPIHFSVVFGEPVFRFGPGAVSLSGSASGLPGAVVAVTNPGGDGMTFDVAVGGTIGDGTVTLAVGAGVAVDAAGNPNAPGLPGPATVTLDTTAPGVTLTPASTGPTNAATLTVAVVFAEPVVGLDTDPARGFDNFSLQTSGTVSGAAVTAVEPTTTPGEYLVTLATGTGQGGVRLLLNASPSVTDFAGNAVVGLPAISAAVAVDHDPPTVILSAPGMTLVPAGTTLTYTVDVRDPSGVNVSVDPGDVTNAGTAGIRVTGLTFAPIPDGVRMTASVRATSDGTVVFRLADTASIADAAANVATLPLTAAGSILADLTAPAVSVSAPGLTRTQPVHFTVLFSEPVTGFGPGAITLAGSAGGLGEATRAVTNPTGDGMTFDVAVGGLTGDGTILLSVAAGAVTDAAGNPNPGSPAAAVTLDTTPPAESAPDLTDESDTGPYRFDNVTADATPTFTGTAEDGAAIELRDGATLLGTAVSTGGAWTVTSVGLSEGLHTVFVRASDATGNTATSAVLGVTIDTVPPGVSVNPPPAPTVVTRTAAIPVVLSFDETVTGLDRAGLMIGGTAGATTATVDGAGQTYTVTVGGMTRPGTVTLAVAAGAAADTAGNPSTAASATVEFAVLFATTTLFTVLPAAATAGETATLSVTVTSSATVVPAGSVAFTLSGPTGISRRLASLSDGAARVAIGDLAPGTYTVVADYAGFGGFAASNTVAEFAVRDAAAGDPAGDEGRTLPPVGQNTTGYFAGAAGRLVTQFTPEGGVAGTAEPFGPHGARGAVADVTGDGTADLILATGPGTAAVVRVLDGVTGAVVLSFAPFDGFTGGIWVAAGDVTRDRRADLIVTPGPGGGPRVLVLSGSDGSVLADFLGIEDPDFRGGVTPAAGDLNADGVADVVVSAGFGGGPRVAGYDGSTLRLGAQPRHLFHDFFLFEDSLRNGASVAVGDVDGDGFGDLVGGAGPGGGPRVVAVSGRQLVTWGRTVQLVNYFAGDADHRGGVSVTAKDIDGDRRTDLVIGAGDGGDILVFLGSGLDAAPPRPAYTRGVLPGFLGGVYVG